MISMTILPRADETGTITWLQDVNKRENLIHLTNDIQVASFDGGMESGKPSVAFIFKLPDDKVVVAETSLSLFVTAARGLSVAHDLEL